MKVDITALLIVFDELITPPTDEALGVYWFRAARADGVIVTLTFSIYEDYTDILIQNNTGTAMASIDMKNCSEIRVLDEKKKCLEIVHDGPQGRCFVALTHDSILNYTELE